MNNRGKPINLYLNPDLVKRFREVAESEKYSVSRFLEKLMEKEVKKYKRRCKNELQV